MLPPDFFLQIPSAAALFVLSSIILPPAASHALPRQTKTLPHRTLNVRSWPLAVPGPTAAAADPRADDSHPRILARQFNTICGYIGGDPDLPATCSAGSHCAVDVEHDAIGCCPDGGPCTEGVYTGCVDAGSGPQTEIDPYVFSCLGDDVCYRNRFEGGYFQYGCGSTTGLAATVAASASGKERLEFTSLSLDLTAEKTSLSEPTTLGTRTSTSESDESSTRTRTRELSTTVEETSTSEPSATGVDGDEGGASAPETSDSDRPFNVGAIVGGTLGGIAFMVSAAVLMFYLWRRNKGNSRQGPGQMSDTQHISSPMADWRHPFAPLYSVEEVDESQVPQDPPRTHGASDLSSPSSHNTDNPVRTVSPYQSSGMSGGAAVGGSGLREHDAMPLTKDHDDGDASLISADSREEQGGPAHGPAHGPYGQYPGPRRGGEGGALWQQTRDTNWL